MIGITVTICSELKSKMKKYHNVGTIIKSNITIVERGKIDTPNTQIHDPHFVLPLSSRLMVVVVLSF